MIEIQKHVIDGSEVIGHDVLELVCSQDLCKAGAIDRCWEGFEGRDELVGALGFGVLGLVVIMVDSVVLGFLLGLGGEIGRVQWM